jgi:predicted enzyme related to lactoylglutathione lyase
MRFCRYDLRTTDLAAARAFYPELLGPGFWQAPLSLSPLPEPARAAGAVPHWLGHVGVTDVEAAAAGFVALGGQRVGPTLRTADGAPFALLRDPWGALLAVSVVGPPSREPVCWHQLVTADRQRALTLYAAAFGWTETGSVELGGGMGTSGTFAWQAGAETVGGMASATRLPEIHPQWLFSFPVPDVTAAMGRVRALGGLALEPVRSSSGDLVAACDDPQGAAFALHQAAR